MELKARLTNQSEIFFITTTVIGWIDVFTRKQLADVIIESLNYCQHEKGLIIYCWCLMPNHLHMIVSTTKDQSVSDIMRDFKKFTAKKVVTTIKEINESRDWMLDKFEFAAKTNSKSDKYKFWRTGFYPILLASEYAIETRLNYIHRNPVKAGLVLEPAFYNYSSAIDYEGGYGLLEVVLLC